MSGFDQSKIDGLRELIKLLLALTRTEQPQSAALPPGPRLPPAAGSAAAGLARAAETIERSGAQAQEAVRAGMQEARAALVRLAQARDTEQQVVQRMLEAAAELKSSD